MEVTRKLLLLLLLLLPTVTTQKQDKIYCTTKQKDRREMARNINTSTMSSASMLFVACPFLFVVSLWSCVSWCCCCSDCCCCWLLLVIVSVGVSVAVGVGVSINDGVGVGVNVGVGVGDVAGVGVGVVVLNAVVGGDGYWLL